MSPFPPKPEPGKMTYVDKTALAERGTIIRDNTVSVRSTASIESDLCSIHDRLDDIGSRMISLREYLFGAVPVDPSPPKHDGPPQPMLDRINKLLGSAQGKLSTIDEILRTLEGL